MREIDLDRLLEMMLDSNDGISDLIFTVGRPLQVEAYGVLKPVIGDPAIAELSSFQTEQIALTLIGINGRLLLDLFATGSCDTSYQFGRKTRFRVNIFRQRGHFGIVMRKLAMDIPTVESLGLPTIFEEIVQEKNGLVLVTGATGSGKTTTLAAMLQMVNRTKAFHIVTLEDPIEFIHPHLQSTFSQRELGLDFDTYPNGVRASLRQAPKVILIGEMRDRATIEIALTAAETGHLVFSTLHTVDAGQSISRVLGMFDRGEEEYLRTRLSDTLRYVVSQRLAPKVGGGRQLLLEIMGSNLRTRESIQQGESEGRTFNEIITDSASQGWITFDQSILRAYEADLITEETALIYSTHKGQIRRAIDASKKARGLIDTREASGLKLDMDVKVDRY